MKNYFPFWLVCHYTLIRLINPQIKACVSIFNTQADIILAGDELWTESTMAFLIENCKQRKSSWVLFSILPMYVLQFEGGSYIFYSITPISVGRCYFQTDTGTSEIINDVINIDPLKERT